MFLLTYIPSFGKHILKQFLILWKREVKRNIILYNQSYKGYEYCVVIQK